MLRALLTLAAFAALQAPVAVKPVAKVDFPAINELSGIAKSKRYPNTYWVHNDSGDSPRIFAIRGNGQLIRPTWMTSGYEGLRIDLAANVDWEEIAIDEENLYIADLGNNGNARRDLGIYVVREPNPEQTDRARTLKWLPIEYPEQKEFPPKGDKPFDCEAMFVHRGKLHFLTKHRAPDGRTPDSSTNLYRLDTEHTDRPNVLRKLDYYANLGGWVTGASISPDGKHLAILTHFPQASVWLFELGREASLGGRSWKLQMTGTGQCEAICWEDDQNVVVTNEAGDIFKLKTSEFTAQKR